MPGFINLAYIQNLLIAVSEGFEGQRSKGVFPLHLFRWQNKLENAQM